MGRSLTKSWQKRGKAASQEGHLLQKLLIIEVVPGPHPRGSHAPPPPNEPEASWSQSPLRKRTNQTVKGTRRQTSSQTLGERRSCQGGCEARRVTTRTGPAVTQKTQNQRPACSARGDSGEQTVCSSALLPHSSFEGCLVGHILHTWVCVKSICLLNRNT